MDARTVETLRPAAWDWAGAQLVCLRESTRVLGPGQAAEDAAQEAVVRAWRQRDQCRDPAHPAPWLRRIAFNEAMRLASRRTEAALDEMSGDSDRLACHDADAVTAAYVRQLVTTLSPLDRRLLFMQVWADIPVHEIAARLRMPEGTVKIRLHRARSRLRQYMEDEL
jgi:RNA polymerase sigma-70 factor (ECF subfamily)